MSLFFFSFFSSFNAITIYDRARKWNVMHEGVGWLNHRKCVKVAWSMENIVRCMYTYTSRTYVYHVTVRYLLVTRKLNVYHVTVRYLLVTRKLNYRRKSVNLRFSWKNWRLIIQRYGGGDWNRSEVCVKVRRFIRIGRRQLADKWQLATCLSTYPPVDLSTYRPWNACATNVGLNPRNFPKRQGLGLDAAFSVARPSSIASDDVCKYYSMYVATTCPHIRLLPPHISLK